MASLLLVQSIGPVEPAGDGGRGRGGRNAATQAAGDSASTPYERGKVRAHDEVTDCHAVRHCQLPVAPAAARFRMSGGNGESEERRPKEERAAAAAAAVRRAETAEGDGGGGKR